MRIESARLEGNNLIFQTYDPEARKLVSQFKPGDYDLVANKKARSLDANRYMWVLCDALADAVGLTKIDVYREAIHNVGVFRDFHLREEDVKSFRVAWGKLGDGWCTEQVDYTQDGDSYIIRAYYGSSTYNTKQMSRLIDWIIQECKSVGVETLSDRELSLLVEAWGEKANQ